MVANFIINAIDKGFELTAKGIDKGFELTAKGIDKGMDVAAKIVGDKIDDAATAVSNLYDTVTTFENKITSKDAESLVNLVVDINGAETISDAMSSDACASESRLK